MFAPALAGPGVSAAFLTLCDEARIEVATPAGLGSLCCGTPWKSKGLGKGYDTMRRRVVAGLRTATRQGELAVVCDASSCTEGLAELLSTHGAAGDFSPRVIDAVDYTLEHVLPLVSIRARLRSLALHPTCSSTRGGSNDALLALARAIADDVVVPDDWSCCGFAGDRGLLHPELTAAATAPEAAALATHDFGAYASCNRTCEIGMTRASGRTYRHLIELVAQSVVPKL